MDMYLLFSLSTVSSISWLCTFCFYFIIIIFTMRYVDLGFPGSSDSKESSCNAGGLGLTPGSGRSPGEGNGNPLQYSCLGNAMEGGAWWAAVHGVPKSRTRLSRHVYTHVWNLSSPTRDGSLTPCSISTES